MASAKLGTKAIGSIVKLNESGVPVEYRIVQQGKPSSGNYDDSCNGTWLRRKDIHSNQQWHTSNTNDYANSAIHKWLNNESSGFLSLLDPDIRAAVKTVKIPYRPGSGTSYSVSSGANGLSCKAFLLSMKETDLTPSYSPAEGAALAYFAGGGNSKRVTNFNGSPARLWSRSPGCHGNDNGAYSVEADGSANSWYCSSSYGCCPALILDSELLVSDDGTVSTNEPPTAPGSIEVSGVVGGSSATIALTAATDPDGTVESYRYERQVDGGAWTQFADVNSLSRTDAISSEWGTVAYRACAVDDAGEAGPYATSQTETVNSGWIIISGPAENLGSKPGPFWFKCSSSITGPAAETTGISVVIGVDNEQKKSATVNAGDVVSHMVDTRLMYPGTHTIDVQATKDDYLPASQSYTFEVPVLVLPDAAVIDFFQNPSAQAILPPTLLRLAIGEDGKDGQTLINAIEKRVEALESRQS